MGLFLVFWGVLSELEAPPHPGNFLLWVGVFGEAGEPSLLEAGRDLAGDTTMTGMTAAGRGTAGWC